MRRSENGFLLVELVVVIGLGAMLTLAAAMFTFHVLNTTEKTEDHLTVTTSVESGGYWIERDASMADNVYITGLSPPTILILKWTEWGYGEENVYHSATYSVENLSNNIGQLNRRHQDSNGADQQIVVASYIYYNPDDPANSTSVSYQAPTIDVKLASRSGNASEARKYQINQRPNF